jgi:hypothetical protein
LQQYIFSVTKELEEQINTFDVPKCQNENTNIFIFSDYGAYNYSTVSSIAQHFTTISPDVNLWVVLTG